MLHSTPPEFRGYVTSHPKVMQPPLGTPDGTRTHTGSILSRLPLPIGLRGRAQNVSQCAGLHRSDWRRVYLPCPPQQTRATTVVTWQSHKLWTNTSKVTPAPPATCSHSCGACANSLDPARPKPSNGVTPPSYTAKA